MVSIRASYPQMIQDLPPFRTVTRGPVTVTIIGWTDPPPVQPFFDLEWLAFREPFVHSSDVQLVSITKQAVRAGFPVLVAGYIHPLTIAALIAAVPQVIAVGYGLSII